MNNEKIQDWRMARTTQTGEKGRRAGSSIQKKSSMSSVGVEDKRDEMRSGRVIVEQDMRIEAQSRLRKPIDIK